MPRVPLNSAVSRQAPPIRSIELVAQPKAFGFRSAHQVGQRHRHTNPMRPLLPTLRAWRRVVSRQLSGGVAVLHSAFLIHFAFSLPANPTLKRDAPPVGSAPLSSTFGVFIEPERILRP